MKANPSSALIPSFFSSRLSHRPLLSGFLVSIFLLPGSNVWATTDEEDGEPVVLEVVAPTVLIDLPAAPTADDTSSGPSSSRLLEKSSSSQQSDLGALREPLTSSSQTQGAAMMMMAPNPTGDFGFIDTSNREEVRLFHNHVYQPTLSYVPMVTWTGNAASCNPGTTLLEFRQATIRAVNVMRALAGVPSNVTLNDVYSDLCQDAALMFHIAAGIYLANGSPHNPHAPVSFTPCYGPTTQLYANAYDAASNSNLSFGQGIPVPSTPFGVGPEAVENYLRDHGDNLQVGHRRWILLPQTEQMGTGDVPQTTSSTYAVNSLWIDDGNGFGPRPETREEFVAWPAPGYFPYTLGTGRWSFHYPGANFTSASVTMTGPGGNVLHSIETRSNTSFYDSAIVWRTTLIDPNSSMSTWPQPSGDTTYQINVSNVQTPSGTRNFSYNVTMFDPAVPTPGYDPLQIQGDSNAFAGQPNAFTHDTIDLATGYELNTLTVEDFSGTEGAENGLTDIIDYTHSSYSLIYSGVRHSGTNSFHLWMPGIFQDQIFEWDIDFFLLPDAQLQFQGALATASTTQYARVQMSNDGGTTWITLDENYGRGQIINPVFSLERIDLTAYIGQTVRFRFAHGTDGTIIGGYSNPEARTGWYIDNITVTNAQVVTGSQTMTLPNSTDFTWVPESPGDYLLQVAPTAWNGYNLGYGQLFPVTVTNPPPRLMVSSFEDNGSTWVMDMHIQNHPGNGTFTLLSGMPNNQSSFTPVASGWSYNWVVPNEHMQVTITKNGLPSTYYKMRMTYTE